MHRSGIHKLLSVWRNFRWMTCNLISSGFCSQIDCFRTIHQKICQSILSTFKLCVFSCFPSQLPTITMRTRCRAVVRNHPKHPSTTLRCRSIEANAESTLRQPWPFRKQNIQREKGTKLKEKRWKLSKRALHRLLRSIMSLEFWYLTQRDGSQIKEDQSSQAHDQCLPAMKQRKLKAQTLNLYLITSSIAVYLMCLILPWTDWRGPRGLGHLDQATLLSSSNSAPAGIDHSPLHCSWGAIPRRNPSNRLVLFCFFPTSTLGMDIKTKEKKKKKSKGVPRSSLAFFLSFNVFQSKRIPKNRSLATRTPLPGTFHQRLRAAAGGRATTEGDLVPKFRKKKTQVIHTCIFLKTHEKTVSSGWWFCSIQKSVDSYGYDHT